MSPMPGVPGAAAAATKSAESSIESSTEESTPTKEPSASPSTKDLHAELKRRMKQHRSLPSCKCQKGRPKKPLPPPGNGKYNCIYTAACVDDTEIVIIMHKKTAGNFAFTKMVDDMIKADPDVRDAFGFDNVYYKVDPTNGSEPLVIEYQNKNGDHRKKYATVYVRKPKGSTNKKKHQKWAQKCLVPYFNKFAQSKYSQAGYGSEQLEYRGDLETDKAVDLLVLGKKCFNALLNLIWSKVHFHQLAILCHFLAS